MDRLAKAILLSLPVLILSTGVLLLNQLRQIRQQIERQNTVLERVAAVPTAEPPPPIRVQMRVDSAWQSLGRIDAPVTVVEFTDYECPYCKQFHSSTFVQLTRDYIAAGKVRWVSRDLPLDMHPYARRAAEAARCAGDEGKYWEMRHAFLMSAQELRDEVISEAAQGISLDLSRFGRCMDSQKYREAVKADAHDASNLRLVHTPSFVVGRSHRDKLEGVVILGAQPYGVFESAIDSLLTRQSKARD